MLDLVAVAAQLRRMRADLSALSDQVGPRLDEALGAWTSAAAMGAALGDRVRRAKTSWLVAEPLEELVAHEVPVHADYRVVATDGSQIFPDRHEAVACYLVNVGIAEIDYRTPFAHLSSAPTLAWLPEDVYPLVGGNRQEADGRVVAARRFAAECAALAARCEPGTIALVDGTLLLWWLEPEPDRLRGLEPDDVKTRTFASLARMLERAREHQTLPAGYLSAPRSTDVVSMLKVVLCTEDPVDCDHCPYASGHKTWTPRRPARGPALMPDPVKPCEEADAVTDARLFGTLLPPGFRSPRFRSAAKVAGAYDAPIDFVYLHTGAEVARVEVPAWVTPGELGVLCGALLDQCEKGLGYPVALSEAHEQAVVRAADRRAFLDLVRRGGAGGPSAKLARKRAAIL